MSTRIGDRERADAADRLTAHAAAVAVGHPVLPPLLLAFVLWRVAWRRPVSGRSAP